MYELKQRGWTITTFNNGIALQATKGGKRLTASTIENLTELINKTI